MNANVFVSYAQNAEDIVLWRALRHVANGTYVDVGAADPVADSVTQAFYERGWSGVNVEPVPALAAALRAARPKDQTFQVAAGREAGTTRLYVSEDTGRSTVMEDVADVNAADGVEVVEDMAEVRTLDDILVAAGLAGRAIHFCKIDVEGAEADVLAGFDLTTWRPWVLVVEATAPQSTVVSHETWEVGVLESGYSFCLFDGLNRFYVASEHEEELAKRLSYPACVFDQPFIRADVTAELERLQSEIERAHDVVRLGQDETSELQRTASSAQQDVAVLAARLASVQRDALAWRNEALAAVDELSSIKEHARGLGHAGQATSARVAELEEILGATHRTVSWRVTRPLRAVRRMQLESSRQPESGRSHSPAVEQPGSPSVAPTGSATPFLAARLWQAVALLDADLSSEAASDGTAGEALFAFEKAIEASSEPPTAKAWLAMVATLASYPTDADVQHLARVVRTEGAGGLIAEMRRRFGEALDAGHRIERGLHVVRDGVVVDVSHTISHDLHTGIQRVVRETLSRWVDDHDITLINFDMSKGYAKALDAAESTRIRSWRDHLHTSGPESIRREPCELSEAVVVPWHSRLLVPELAGETLRCDAYRPLAQCGVLSGLGLIGYDFIPVTATETVTDAMSSYFANYLSFVKHATRLSAISDATAREFQAFGRMLASQGLSGPEVVAHPLPSERPPKIDEDIEQVRRRLRLEALPLVLVVGSHEPRKNHVAVLEASQSLWRSGEYFHLLMIGGSGWRGGEFDDYVNLLQSEGQPLTVWRRASERDLWASYHLARFTMFPSLVEGYGLPIAESLACGTPAITSNFGSMADVAAHGGAITVDPRDVDALKASMRSLLTDDALVARLGEDALQSKWGSWDDYARDVWQHLNA